MKFEFPSGRRWLTAASLAALVAVTGFYGIRAAENPTPTVSMSTRSEAASGRGYSAIVKKVLPAVVNISSSKVIKQTALEGGGGQGLDPFFRQFFGNDFGQRFNV